MAVSSILQKKKRTLTASQQANRDALAGSSKNNLSQIQTATQNAASIPKPSNWLGSSMKVTQGQPISSAPKSTATPTVPTNPFFDTFKTDTFKRLGVADEAEFNSVTGLNFTDTYGSEYNKLHSGGHNTQPLDSLIGETFRTHRDAGSQINQLNSQLNSTTGSLSGGDKYLGLQDSVNKAIQGGATDANSIASATGLSASLVTAIQQGNIEAFNAEIGSLQEQIKNYGETDSSITRNAEIARSLGVSEDLVKKITSGDATNVGVSDTIKAQLTKDAELGLQRYEEDYYTAKERAKERLKEYEADFLVALDNQKATNAIIEGNTSRLAGISGAGFSSRGLGGIEEVTRQSIGIIQEMQTLYDRSVASVGHYLEKLETDYVRKNEDVQASINDSINNVTQSYIANIESIKGKFGEVSDEAIQRLNDASATYLENIIDVEQQGFDNMVTINDQMRANMSSAIEMSTFTTQESQRIATQLVNTGASMTDVTALVESGQLTVEQAREVQSQMVSNTMATLSSIPGAEALAPQYSQEIIQGINEGKTPFEILDSITSDAKFKVGLRNAGMSPIQDAQLQNLLLENQALSNELNPQGNQTILNEQVVDTGIQNVYGSTVKLAPTVAVMIQNAQNTLAEQGIDLKIGDSYRSTETQAQAYASGKEGVAPPGHSFHEVGQAIDLSQVSADGMNNEKVFQALRDAGLQQHPGEWWHWSYGEFGEGEVELSGMAQQVLNGTMKMSEVPSADRGSVANELATSGKAIVSRKSVEMAQSTIDTIADLKEMEGLKAAIGQSTWKSLIPGTPAYDARQKIEQVKSITVIPMLEHMKGLGSMSEVEFNTMAKSANALDRGLSEDMFYKELTTIEEGMRKIIEKTGGKIATATNDSSDEFEDIDNAVNATQTTDDKMKDR